MSSHSQPPAPAWPGYDDNAPPPRQSPGPLVLMVAGAVIFGAGCGGGLVCGWVAAVARTWGNPFAGAYAPGSFSMQPDATVAAEHPETIRVGEEVELTLTVTDTRGQRRTVADVYVQGALADQFEYVQIDPKPKGQTVQYGFHSYNLNEPIDASATTTITFTIKPKVAGAHAGTIEIVMGDYHTVSTPLTLTVEGE